MPGRSTLARLFLLAVLAFGVACMHTLGHQGLAGHDVTVPAGHMAGARDPQLMISDAVVSLSSGSSMPGMAVDPLAVCLAILGLTLAIVMMLHLLAAARHLAPWSTVAPAAGQTGRGPPGDDPMIGLRLSTIAVMRT